jgi:hypothetical protein
MARRSYIDIEIDKLTNSIENVFSGDVFDTEVIKLTKSDFKKIKKREWIFDWQHEFVQSGRVVYKLVIKDNEDIIQGLISLSIEIDHVYMHLIESSKFNKGKGKIYAGVSGNLVAFACHFSQENGFDGFLAFDAKTVLIKHYQETLKATHLRGSRMYIDNIAAKRLIQQYFKK